MTELELYKFIKDYNIEYHKIDDEVVIFLSFSELAEFVKLISYNYFDDAGEDIVLKKEFVCIKMKDICQYYDIELQKVFEDKW